MTAGKMRAWAVDVPGQMSTHPLALVERDVPEPGTGQVRVRVSVCGVCRTDLHLAEGDLSPRHHLVIPGHEVVGRVDAVGPESTRFNPGDRIGVPWLAHTCGLCRFCRSSRENLCLNPSFTGWDVDGGYAEYVIVNEGYAYPIPDVFSDIEAAPLLCAGIIGFRALRCSGLPPGGRLGIYGFGGSAHLTAQIALAEGARLHVMTRSPAARELALELGASSAGDATDMPPIPSLNYDRHLFEERSLRSVTANTRANGAEFLETAARIGINVSTSAYAFDDANAALVDLAQDRVNGAAVLVRPSQ